MKSTAGGTRILAAAMLSLLVALSGRAMGQSCDTFDPCMIGGMCQPDGECVGTPLPNGTSCNDFNDCTVNDQCQQGQCSGSADLAKDGQPCDLGLGLCATAICNVQVFDVPGFPPFEFAQCLPEDFVECGDDGDGNACTFSFCNPATGQCQPITNECFGECAACDPTTGDCTANPKPNGAACDDFNPCTANDGCQGGECVSGGLTGPSPTRTATGVAVTPTRTNTPAPPTATRTNTALPPTATRTTTRTATRTPTVAGPPCFADCDGDGDVDAADLQKMSAVIVQCGPCAGGVAGGVAAGCPAAPGGCAAADFNGDGCLRASDLTRALQNVLTHPPDGCPP